ncbi:MAG TPA: type II secretion system protein [Myxococcaceae bacterium]|nr:type II secretion system protein [Myxococcaceae bacterium]
MRVRTSTPRGMALMMSLIVVVLITLLVAGAISFTGTERGAAVLQTRADTLSACTQAARNLFLARLRVLPATNADGVELNDAYGEGLIRTAHYTGAPPTLTHVERIPANAVGASRDSARDIGNTLGDAAEGAWWYSVTALCQEYPGGPEREVEFVVRVGLQ